MAGLVLGQQYSRSYRARLVPGSVVFKLCSARNDWLKSGLWVWKMRCGWSDFLCPALGLSSASIYTIVLEP